MFLSVGYEKLGINNVVQTIAVKTGKKDKRDKDEVSNIGSFHAKSINFEQKSDMTIFDFAEICCN